MNNVKSVSAIETVAREAKAVTHEKVEIKEIEVKEVRTKKEVDQIGWAVRLAKERNQEQRMRSMTEKTIV